MKIDRIVIIDFGGQYSHLIGRRLRDIGLMASIVGFDEYVDLTDQSIKGIILSGGPRSVGEIESSEIPNNIKKILHDKQKPVLGICYGHQLLGKYFNGEIKQSISREYGPTTIEIINKSKILPNTDEFISWMSHGDHVETVGEGLMVTSKSEGCPVTSMESKGGKIFGLQFHPEVTHTEGGKKILEKFAREICDITISNWDISLYREQLVQEMRDKIGTRNVLLGVSGGVDSLVASLILKEAVGDQLHCVFINHGLLRKEEVDQVTNYYNNILDFTNFHYINAIDQFIDKLEGVIDPEEKRKIIGHTFIEVFEEQAFQLAEKYGKLEILAQGTIYSDRIESGAVGSGSAKIKSHHNLTLPDEMSMTVLEPLKDLYKDEVRQLGRVLQAPEELINRYPFPGPGLAVRIIGEVTKKRIKILQEADYIFREILRREELGDEVWQAFAVLIPVNTVGVQGDNRVYGELIALRSVKSKEGMTADFSRLDYELLSQVSSKIINRIPEITRVVYDISSKPPATIEFE